MIVDVAVPVAGLDEALSYAVPAALAARARPGVRVLVPVAGRRLIGVVVDVRAAPPARELKLVADVLDDDAVATEQQLALARFVAGYYGEPLGACARLVLPPDTDVVAEPRFALTERGEQARVFSAAHELSRVDLELLGAFAPGERKRERQLARTPARRARLRGLVERGLVERVADERLVGAVRFDEAVVPLDDGQALPPRAPALAAFDAWLRAFCAQAGRGATRAEADAAMPGARGKVAKLAALGRVRVERTVRAAARAAPAVPGKRPATALNDAQQAAADAVLAALAAKAPTAFLLEGVTGSGKTEVYLRALSAALAQGRGALLLVPEIALTPQLVGRVQAAVADPALVVVLHSGVSVADRRDALARLRAGSARVVVGARSALFAPVRELGLVVVDEEHDGSLKQDECPRYHARDVALWRAKHEGAVCVLGSATPSLESRHNATQGKLVTLELPLRHGAALPALSVIDLRARGQQKEARRRDRDNADEGPGVVLSGPLVEAMAGTLAAGQQVLLFLNKRGYASALFCEACGHVESCQSCSVSLTYHKRRHLLVCHQCDHERRAPSSCPACATEGMLLLGLGTERVESEVKARFPDARVARLDRDTARHKGNLERVLADVHAGQVDVLIGTQMVAKGHDFAGVQLVGVVLADVALSLPDFRAAERAFALLAQVAGRAGRSGTQGRVLVQTFQPEHAAVRFALTHDAKGFAAEELELRRALKYPPFSRAALVRVECADEDAAGALASSIAGKVKRAGAALPQGTWSVLGPAPCPLERLHGRSRWQVFVRAQTTAARAALVGWVRGDAAVRADLARAEARLVVDLDPVHLL
ncbi:MAG: primosomal protein N' [Deltaproteobacteria bacterium]|nr:primosomal protein N' [Deltaproteobacteria bacterium]